MSTHPAKQTASQAFPNLAAAASDTYAAFRAPHAGTVTAVTYTPDATITGAATNNRAVSLINKGQDGNGTTVVASLTFDNGVNADDYDEKTITLSAVAGATDVAAGDILAWSTASAGTGIADPGGIVKVEFTRGDVSA